MGKSMSLVIFCFVLAATGTFAEEHKSSFNDSLTQFAIDKIGGSEEQVRKWYLDIGKKEIVLAGYNEDMKRQTQRHIAKNVLIWSTPAYIIGLGLTMGCGDVPNPASFCKRTYTKAGT